MYFVKKKIDLLQVQRIIHIMVKSIIYDGFIYLIILNMYPIFKQSLAVISSFAIKYFSPFVSQPLKSLFFFVKLFLSKILRYHEG